jgi:hypothetical protein
MKNYVFSFAFAFLLVIIFGFVPNEKRIRRSKVPKTILDYLNKEYPQSKHLKFYIETSKDTVFYEVEFESKDNFTLKFLENGTLLEIEKEVEFEDLPEGTQKAILKSLSSQFKNFKITSVEFFNPHLKIEYELGVRVKSDAGIDMYDIHFDEHGNLLRQSERTPNPIQTLF